MKKYIKIFLTIVASFSPLAFLIYYSNSWTKYSSLSVAGSSSLQPLMIGFSDKWESNTDIIVQGGGSGFGMKSIAMNTKDIGMASKNIYSSLNNADIKRNGYDKTTWDNRKIKTLTIGWDSIVIVYKNNNDLRLSLPTGNNIDKTNSMYILYEMFSGKRKVKVKELIPNYNNDSFFVPYSRTGGANASGTATSFMYESGFMWEKYSGDSDIKLIESAIKSGNYLNNNVRITNESNVESWNKVKNENQDNAITYLSLSFVIQNYKIIKDNGFRVATFNDINPIEYLMGPTPQKMDVEFLKKYKWFSPFNIMISLLEIENYLEVRQFVKWIYTSKEAYNVFIKQGIVPINDNQQWLESTNILVKSMINNDLLNSSDTQQPSNPSFTVKDNFDLIFNQSNADITYKSVNGDDKSYGVSKETVLNLKNNKDN